MLSRLAEGVRVDGEDVAQLELEIELVPRPRQLRFSGELLENFLHSCETLHHLPHRSLQGSLRLIACSFSVPGGPRPFLSAMRRAAGDRVHSVGAKSTCAASALRVAAKADGHTSPRVPDPLHVLWPVTHANLGSLSRALSRLSQVS